MTYRTTRGACYLGYVVQATVNNLAPLLFVLFTRDYGLSATQTAGLIFANFLSQLVIDLVAVKWVDRIGYRVFGVCGQAFCLVGLVLLGALPLLLGNTFVALLVAVVVYSIGGGSIESLISPVIDALPSAHKSRGMAVLHSFYCWGQALVVAVSTLCLRLLGEHLWFVLPFCWALLPLVNLVLFCTVPLPATVPPHEKTPVGTLFRSPLFVLALVGMLCAGASELIMAQWASLFVETGLGVSKVVGDLAGPCAFALLMGAGRLLYGIFGDRLPLEKLLVGSSALCIVCYLVAALVPNAVVSLLGCALTGLSVSLMWPGTLAVSSRRFPTGGGAAFAMFAVAGDVGCMLGPALVGPISDLVQQNGSLVAHFSALGIDAAGLGMRAGLLFGCVFPLVMLATSLVSLRLSARTAAQAQTDARENAPDEP